MTSTAGREGDAKEMSTQEKQAAVVTNASTSATVGRADAASTEPRWLVFGERYGLVAVLLGVLLLFGIVNSTFFTVENWQVIGATQSVTAVLALAFLLPLVGGDFDVSVGANAIVGSVACAACTSKYGWPLATAIAIPIAIGLAIGWFNGVLVTRLRLNALIATLGTATVLSGLVIWYTDGVPISTGIARPLLDLGSETLLGIPWLAIVALVMCAVMHYVLTQTPYGRRLAATGSNRSTARLVGIRVRWTTMASFVAAGGLAGIGGILLVAQTGSANPTANGIATLIPALTVAFLGASAFRPGEFNVAGMLVALVLVTALVSGLALMGVADWVSPVCNGVALIAGVGLSAYFRAKRLGGFEM